MQSHTSCLDVSHLPPPQSSGWLVETKPIPPGQLDRETLRYFDKIFQLGAQLAAAPVPWEVKEGFLVAQLSSALCLPTCGEAQSVSVGQKWLSSGKMATHVSISFPCVHIVPAGNHVGRNVLTKTNYISQRAGSTFLPSAQHSHISVIWWFCLIVGQGLQ